MIRLGAMITQGDLLDVIFEIEGSELQVVGKRSEIGTFELKTDSRLLSDLSGNCGAFIVRSILHELNINEHHVFKWRLENKFKRYQILTYYIPGCMPKTLSFSKLFNQRNGVQQIKELFTKGFFLKATLGDASFSTNSWDKTAEFDKISALYDERIDGFESYMLQKRLAIQCEFRIHTFSKEVIPVLTYVMQGQIPPDKHAGVEQFMNEILQKLSDVILQGTMIAWDIALTDTNQYYIIEANLTGFHPEYRAGFQTSGYVDDHHYGPVICAWLNNYFNKRFEVYINAVESELLVNNPFYKAFLFYISIFKSEHIDLINTRDNPLTAVIYLAEDTSKSMITLIRHFLLVNYAELYAVIARADCFPEIRDLFSRKHQVNIWNEHELFTKDEYQLVKQLSDKERKQVCCVHLAERLQTKNYVII